MGFTNANIHIKRREGMTADICAEIAAYLAQGHDWTPVRTAEEADAATAVYFDENRRWVTVVSDVLESDMEGQLKLAKEFSARYNTQALAIGCVDSDYLYINWLDEEKQRDLWASSGSAAAVGITGMRRSNFAAWKDVVADVGAFRDAMKNRNVFAEECLTDLAGMLDLPVDQSMMGAEEAREVNGARLYYYAAAQAGDTQPAQLKRGSSNALACRNGGQGLVQVVNCGGESRGLRIMITGSAVNRQALRLSSAQVETDFRNGERKTHPLEWTEVALKDGGKALEAELPALRLYSVPEDLPATRRMHAESERAILFRFCPETEGEEEYLDLTVFFVPIDNQDGFCYWRGRMPTEEEKRRLFNPLASRPRGEESTAPSRPIGTGARILMMLTALEKRTREAAKKKKE